MFFRFWSGVSTRAVQKMAIVFVGSFCNTLLIESRYTNWMLVTNFLDVSGMKDVSVLHRIRITQVRFISFCKSVIESSF